MYQENALLVVLSMKDRISTYVKNQRSREYDLTAVSNEVGTLLGYNYPIRIVASLSTALQTMDYLRIFLDEVL
jgi:hypothetical protein